MVITPIQHAILRHVRRYHISLRPVFDVLFYGGTENACDGDLTQLRKLNLLASIENAVADPRTPNVRYSYYQLTNAGARLLGASKHRTRKLGGQGLARNLAILWFCCFKSPRRHRLSETELCDILGEETVFRKDSDAVELRLNGLHCLDRTESSFRLLHLYAPKTSAADVIVELRKRIRDAYEIPRIAQAIADNQYGYAILAETNEARDEMRRLIANAFAGTGIGFLVTTAPSTWKRPR